MEGLEKAEGEPYIVNLGVVNFWLEFELNHVNDFSHFV